jgi:hypothetical protein
MKKHGQRKGQMPSQEVYRLVRKFHRAAGLPAATANDRSRARAAAAMVNLVEKLDRELWVQTKAQLASKRPRADWPVAIVEALSGSLRVKPRHKRRG